MGIDAIKLPLTASAIASAIALNSISGKIIQELGNGNNALIDALAWLGDKIKDGTSAVAASAINIANKIYEDLSTAIKYDLSKGVEFSFATGEAIKDVVKDVTVYAADIAQSLEKSLQVSAQNARVAAERAATYAIEQAKDIATRAIAASQGVVEMHKQRIENSIVQSNEMLANVVLQATNNVAGSIKEIVNKIGQQTSKSESDIAKVLQAITGRISDTQQITEEVVKNAVSSALSNVSKTLGDNLERIGESIGKNVSTAVSSAISSISLLQGKLEHIANTIEETSKSESEAIKESIKSVVDEVAETTEVYSQAIEATSVNISDAIEKHATTLKTVFEDAIGVEEKDFTGDIPAILTGATAFTPALTGLLSKIGSLPKLFKWLTSALVLQDVFAELKQATFQPAMEKLHQDARKLYRDALVSAGDIVELWKRGHVSESFVYEELAKQGFSNERINLLLLLARQFLSVDTIATLVLRKVISVEQAEEYASKLGILPDDFRAYLETRKQLLPADALIEAVYRNILSLEEAKEYAAKLGIQEQDFELLHELKISLLNPADLIRAYWRGAVRKEQVFEIARKQGYQDESIELMFEILKPVYDETTIRELYFRGQIDKDEAKRRMKMLGWDDEEIEQIQAVWHAIPSVSDMVRFAVREVFTPEIVQKYGMLEDLPDDFIKNARLVGLNEEWAKAYWAAHWELPSIQLGFEMFHRKIITKEELVTLLRTLDVMPFWREKLIQVAYQPLTRVDLRRIWELGLIDEQELLTRLEYLGYSPEDARLMLEYYKVEKNFAELAQKAEGRELTKTEVLNAYKNKLLSFDEAKRRLVEDLYYSEDEAEYLLLLQDYKEMQDYKEKKIKALIKRYVNEVISYDDLVVELNKLNLTAQEIDKVISEAETEMLEKVKLPTKADLYDWLKLKLINLKEYEQYLKVIGYPENFARLYVEQARKELRIRD